jgi:uncharacterized membrane protein
MKGSNEVATRKATRIELVLFAGAAFVAIFNAVLTGPGWLQDFSIGFAILFSGFGWFFLICYFRELDPYRLLRLRPSPKQS